MKNNKGFSLVELIIVIAIMAILVGVLAPQLIKYIEKTNVSNDVQVCDTVRTALTTALTDAMVLADPNYVDPTTTASWTGGIDALTAATGATAFDECVRGAIGVPAGTAIDTYLQNQCKSFNAKTNVMTVEFNSSSILVWIPQTDMSGTKTAQSAVSSTGSSAIYAGPAQSFGY